MSKNRQKSQSPSLGHPQPPPARLAPKAPLPGFARLAISLLLAWHVAAVFMAPLSVPPSSEFVSSIAQQPPMQWYLDLFYLNHGYHFFAPDPGDGHLIRYEVSDINNRVIAEGEFPNVKDQWPRLRYHRHFMLTDQAGLPLPDEQEREDWQRKYLRSYAQHLLRVHEGETARLQYIIHYALYREDALQEMALDDPKTYETLLEVVQRRADLEQVDSEKVDRQDGFLEHNRAASRPVGGRR